MARLIILINLDKNDAKINEKRQVFKWSKYQKWNVAIKQIHNHRKSLRTYNEKNIIYASIWKGYQALENHVTKTETGISINSEQSYVY